MPLDANEVRDQLAAYVLGDIALDVFEDWFVGASWNVQKTGPKELQELVFAIEAKLAEYSGGHIQEPSLRKSLAELAMQYATVIAYESPEESVVVRTSSFQDVSEPAEWQIAFADIEPGVVHA